MKLPQHSYNSDTVLLKHYRSAADALLQYSYSTTSTLSHVSYNQRFLPGLPIVLLIPLTVCTCVALIARGKSCTLVG